jgi:hypothetical protein
LHIGLQTPLTAQPLGRSRRALHFVSRHAKLRVVGPPRRPAKVLSRKVLIGSAELGSALGELQLAEQETISAHIVKALGSPEGLV